MKRVLCIIAQFKKNPLVQYFGTFNCAHGYLLQWAGVICVFSSLQHIVMIIMMWLFNGFSNASYYLYSWVSWENQSHIFVCHSFPHDLHLFVSQEYNSFIAAFQATSFKVSSVVWIYAFLTPTKMSIPLHRGYRVIKMSEILRTFMFFLLLWRLNYVEHLCLGSCSQTHLKKLTADHTATALIMLTVIRTQFINFFMSLPLCNACKWAQPAIEDSITRVNVCLLLETFLST